MTSGQSVLSPATVVDLVKQFGNASVAIGTVKNKSHFFMIGSGFVVKQFTSNFIVATCAHVISFSQTISVRFAASLTKFYDCHVLKVLTGTNDVTVLRCNKSDHFPEGYIVDAPEYLPMDRHSTTGIVRNLIIAIELEYVYCITLTVTHHNLVLVETSSTRLLLRYRWII